VRSPAGYLDGAFADVAVPGRDSGRGGPLGSGPVLGGP
jgi:hypothetical protein